MLLRNDVNLLYSYSLWHAQVPYNWTISDWDRAFL